MIKYTSRVRRGLDVLIRLHVALAKKTREYGDVLNDVTATSAEIDEFEHAMKWLDQEARLENADRKAAEPVIATKPSAKAIDGLSDLLTGLAPAIKDQLEAVTKTT